MSNLVDGGERLDFGTGAVREPSKGKGRCDLLQLREIGEYYHCFNNILLYNIFESLSKFVYHQDVTDLYFAIDAFARYTKKAPEELWLMDALQMEDGARKYASRNWENGIPTARYIDSAVRHLLKYLLHEKNENVWNDEPHDRAFIWNIMCAAWNMNHRPDLNDLPNVDQGLKE